MQTICDHSEVDRQEIDQRLKALGSIYQTADSILAGERLKVAVVEPHHATMRAPAWTDGTTITLNSQCIAAPDFEDIVRLHGLNFHELAHVQYTPRKGTALVSWVLDNGYMHAFNALEDQRIETLMTLRYPSTVPWLTAAILRWVLETPTSIEGAYALIRGRRYLPGSLRAELRRAFLDPTLLPEIDYVVDSYRRLVFPNDYDAARDLIERFHQVLSKMQPQMGCGLPDPHGHIKNGGEVLDKGRPVSVAEQRKIRDKMAPDASRKDGQDGGREESSDSQGSSESDADQDDSMPGDESPTNNVGSNLDTDGMFSSDYDDDDEGSGSTEAQSGATASGGGPRPDPFDLSDLAQDLLDNLFDDVEVTNEVRRTQRQMRMQGGEAHLERVGYVDHIDPDEKYVLIYRRLRAALERFRNQADPGWHREEPIGRLNAARWAIRRDIDNAFDRWEEGVHDAMDLDVILLMDYSGSMGTVTHQVSNAMWALKSAMDAVSIPCTVIPYDHQSKILYSGTERAQAKVMIPWMGGGTDPGVGLEYAARHFSRSTHRHKVLITVTDGEWGGGTDEYDMTSDDYIQKMNNAGVLTALGFIVDPNAYWNSHLDMSPEGLNALAVQNSHGSQIALPADGDRLVDFVSRIVGDLIRRQLRGVA